MRASSRQHNELRQIRLTKDYLPQAEGSVLVEFGNTKVICTASIDGMAPAFLRGSGQGWITAEYGMLPRSTNSRMRREASLGKQNGRTQEIQRLIGRSLRSIVNLKKLGERQIIVDCDVIQADGGTRTASITGAYVALACALKKLQQAGVIEEIPLMDQVAAVSVGIKNGEAILDLDYLEDSSCDTDMNIVMTGKGGFVEIQGTAEGEPFLNDQLQSMLALASTGIHDLLLLQQQTLSEG